MDFGLATGWWLLAGVLVAVELLTGTFYLLALALGAAAAALAAHAGAIDGIFAATDTLASLCLTALRERGLAVPDDVRLVGFDDLPIARQTVPPLTTIRQDIAAGARGLVQLLLRRLAGEETESLILPPQLMIRQSA